MFEQTLNGGYGEGLLCGLPRPGQAAAAALTEGILAGGTFELRAPDIFNRVELAALTARPSAARSTPPCSAPATRPTSGPGLWAFYSACATADMAETTRLATTMETWRPHVLVFL